MSLSFFYKKKLKVEKREKRVTKRVEEMKRGRKIEERGDRKRERKRDLGGGVEKVDKS